MKELESGFLPLKDMLFIAFFAAITGVLGYLTLPLPFSPVPVTAQTLGVMLSGILLGSRNGFISMTVLLLLGMAGIPVFSGGRAGIGIIVGPTGGYLISFPVAAFLGGYIIQKLKDRSFLNYLWASIFSGIFVIYILGIIQLKFVTGINWYAALLQGVIPFLAGDIFKAFAASFLALRLKPFISLE